MKIRFITKFKLLKKIIDLSNLESNDFVFGGKTRNLIRHFQETGEIKQDQTDKKF